MAPFCILGMFLLLVVNFLFNGGGWFTPHCRELLLGVSAGGMGTLVASLASLISYKIYATEYKVKKYLRSFTLLNIGILSIIVLFLLFCPL